MDFVPGAAEVVDGEVFAIGSHEAPQLTTRAVDRVDGVHDRVRVRHAATCLGRLDEEAVHAFPDAVPNEQEVDLIGLGDDRAAERARFLEAKGFELLRRQRSGTWRGRGSIETMLHVVERSGRLLLERRSAIDHSAWNRWPSRSSWSTAPSGPR